MKRSMYARLVGIAVLLGLGLAVATASAAEKFAAGQRAQAREGDVWSDVTILKVEGRRYQIKYQDGAEEWVTVDRLRPPQGGAPADGGQATGAKGPGAISLDSPSTEIQLRPAKGVDKRANAPIAVKPTTQPAAAYTNLTPSSGLPLGNVQDLSICPDEPSIAIAIGSRRGDDTPLVAIDTANPDNTAVYVLTAPEHNVVCAGDAGKLVVTKPAKWGSNTLHLWEYREGSYELKANYAFVADGKRQDPNWARLLSPTRLLIRVGFGQTFLIDLRSKSQVAYIQCGDIKIHSGGRYLLSSKDQSNLVLRASDLAIVADLPGGPSRLSIDPTGTLAAMESGRKVIVTKLSNKSTVSETDGIGARGDFELVGTNMLLVNGAICYDLKTGVPLWNYAAPGSKSIMLANGQVLYVGANKGQTYACMAAVPDSLAIKARDSMKPDLFALAPGARIQIEGDLSPTGNADEALKVLTNVIKNAGHVVADASADYKLAISITPGKTEKIDIRETNRMGPPIIREYDAPSAILNAALLFDGQEIWKAKHEFRAKVMIMRQGNETLQQAIDRDGKVTPNRLAGLDIPSYLVKGGSTDSIATLGESTLTMTGFVPKADKTQ